MKTGNRVRKNGSIVAAISQPHSTAPQTPAVSNIPEAVPFLVHLPGKEIHQALLEISKKTGAHPERMAGAMVALAIRDSAVLSKMGGLPRQKQGKSKRECIKIYLPHGAKEKARAVAECIGWRVNALAWYALMVHLHDLRKQLGLSDGQELRVSKSHRRELARRRVLVERTYIHGGIWPSRN